MGVDAEMKVRVGTPLTDDELLTLQAAFREKFPIDSEGDPPYPWIDRDRSERDTLVLAVTMLDRYYGPYYPAHEYPFGWQHVGSGMFSCSSLIPVATCCVDHGIGYSYIGPYGVPAFAPHLHGSTQHQHDGGALPHEHTEPGRLGAIAGVVIQTDDD